ncbi:MAG TPA: S-formylglutathione hydrolase [Dongiaceae bacterium]|nr:S-formylglutathione hydrolase [Dongiaceae bacterium]
MNVSETSRHHCFDGWQIFATHPSRECGGSMKFSLYLPPAAARGKVPVLYYLAGLTCTEETFVIKGGAQRFAAETGVAIAAPDTSPRGTGTPGADADWDFGFGAGFYVDATQEPWAKYWRMYSYVTSELPRLLAENYPIDPERQGIFGHSMGGHGALVAAFRNPGQYRSVSAFAPIAAPSRSPWGKKAFTGYLGEDRRRWDSYDASELVQRTTLATTILIDQGLDDPYLAEQLHPHLFEEACRQANQAIVLRRHQGYDHGYYFIQTFIADHVRHHARQISAAG